MSNHFIDGVGFQVIDGVGQETLDSMVALGLAHKESDYYLLTEYGKEWLSEWCAEQLVKLGAELQLPLDGFPGGTWIVYEPPEGFRDGGSL